MGSLTIFDVPCAAKSGCEAPTWEQRGQGVIARNHCVRAQKPRQGDFVQPKVTRRQKRRGGNGPQSCDSTDRGQPCHMVHRGW